MKSSTSKFKLKKKIQNLPEHHKRLIWTSCLCLILIGSCFLVDARISGKVIDYQNQDIPSQLNKPFVKPIITRDNFVDTLQKQSIIRELPKGAELSLVFRDTGEAYVISQGSINSGKAGNPDLTISILSKYIPESYNFCSAIKQANKNGDLGYALNPEISKTALAWKYKGMMKYRECLG